MEMSGLIWANNVGRVIKPVIPDIQFLSLSCGPEAEHVERTQGEKRELSTQKTFFSSVNLVQKKASYSLEKKGRPKRTGGTGETNWV